MIKRLIVAAACMAVTVCALAVPSIDAVQAEMAQGRYGQAEALMREVVADKPDSARARYVYAELLAHNGHFALASEEAAQAQRLDPALSFTDPEKFKAFRRLLERERGSRSAPASAPDAAPLAAPFASTPAPRPAEPAPAGLPSWAWAAGAALLAYGGWRALAGRTGTASATQVAPSPVGLGAGTVPVANPLPATAAPMAAPPPPAVAGSGMLGTGLAVAGGMAAGVLAERLLEGRHAPVLGLASTPPPPILMPSLLDPTAGDDDAAQALRARAIDMGSGDDWDAGSGAIDTGTDPSSGGDGW